MSSRWWTVISQVSAAGDRAGADVLKGIMKLARARVLALGLAAGIGSADCSTAAPPPARTPDSWDALPLTSDDSFVFASGELPATEISAIPASATPFVARHDASKTLGALSSQNDSELSPAVAPPVCAAWAGKLTVRRSALSHTLDAGMGSWLRGVDVEPKVERGHFQGWLLRALFAGDPCWSDVGLQAGDVVNRVNHHPIEKPEQAHAVWTALRRAPEISVEFIRAGQTRSLTFSVLDDAGPRAHR